MVIASLLPRSILLVHTVNVAFSYKDSFLAAENEIIVSQWSEWLEWSACIGQLDGTVQRRSRECLGKHCAGKAEEIRLCDKYIVPQFSESAMKSQWGQWGDYSSCSASCGGGFQTRTRLCYEKCPGCACKGASAEQRPCNAEECCEWTSWTVWSQCTITCGEGGYRYRTRQCTCEKCSEGPTSEQTSCANNIPCNVRKRICTFQLFRGFPLKIC